MEGLPYLSKQSAPLRVRRDEEAHPRCRSSSGRLSGRASSLRGDCSPLRTVVYATALNCLPPPGCASRYPDDSPFTRHLSNTSRPDCTARVSAS